MGGPKAALCCFVRVVVVLIAVLVFALVVVVVELKQIEQIANGRAVFRHVSVIVIGNGIREVVSAALRERLEPPVALDELQDGNVVRVRVADVAAARER